ncbi:uncharacterized protein C8Q71DRAFT_46832 [Rhodofomes roseus]|uniref:3'-5' exonuclease n=1 Tax=Rhodofomes roseus TaxID=34475 RepID=A0ABQ8KFI0_9APHY|nr:uncharacterized protein C8Q71DRAFT_46832 [Rhodofomes roseus]KAH9836533.1 hypothetical protein C8Q71DRAFT_46832 [Rhodofomes roseus]
MPGGESVVAAAASRLVANIPRRKAQWQTSIPPPTGIVQILSYILASTDRASTDNSDSFPGSDRQNDTSKTSIPVTSTLRPILLRNSQLALKWTADAETRRGRNRRLTFAYWSCSLTLLKSSLMAATLNLQAKSTVKTVTAPQWPLYSWRTKSPNARLVYIRDVDEANIEISKLRPGPLGLDMEWKPCFFAGEREHPVALVQLANDEVVLLIQVSAMSSFPEKLSEVLGSPQYVKAGVAIKGDCTKLYRDFSVICRNCVDLSLLSRTVDNPRWKGPYKQSIGLNRLCEAYEELSLQKGKITRSNWELVLSVPQQEYAANDSHSGYILYCRLAAMAAAMFPPPLIPWYTFDFIGRALNPESGMEWVMANPNYDPGPPPPVPIPPQDWDPETSRSKRRNRRRENDDLPHASNVSVVHSQSSSFSGGNFRHGSGMPLPNPVLPHGGPSRHVAALGSFARHPADVPAFVPRGSANYHTYHNQGQYPRQQSRGYPNVQYAQHTRGPPSGHHNHHPNVRGDEGEIVFASYGMSIVPDPEDEQRGQGQPNAHHAPTASGSGSQHARAQMPRQHGRGRGRGGSRTPERRGDREGEQQQRDRQPWAQRGGAPQRTGVAD